jgi:alpha-glucoside transport system substrate-binding protein
VNDFVLPGATTSEASPILVGGDLAVQFNENPAVDALMAYLAGSSAGSEWARHGGGGFLSPKSSFDDRDYPADYLETLAGALAWTTALGFDASDQMPPAIGAGLLWREITEWVTGQQDYTTFAETGDAAFEAALEAEPPPPGS